MAENATLGRLFVDLLLRDEQFRNGLKGSEKALKASGRQFDAYAKTISTGLVTALKAATAASAGLVAAAAAVGAGFEKQMDAVAAVRGITSETSGEFLALEEQARSLGATTAFSATEAAQGMEALARAGLQTNEIIAASEVALKLAGAGQIELGRSAEILAGTMAQFGMNASETTRIADVFTAATQNTLFGTEDLAQAMKFAGTVGAAFGKDIEETTAAVAMFRNLGLEGTMAGTQFRMMMAAAAKPTGEAEAALAKYGLTIEQINPETNSFADILKAVGDAGVSTADSLSIFGTEAGANVAALSQKFAESTQDYDQLLGTLRQAGEEGELTAQTYEQMTDNVMGRLAQLRSVVEETMLSLFERFRGPLTALLTSLVDFVGAVASELGARGLEIGGNFESLFGTLTAFIQQNTQTGAKAMVEFIVTMQNAASAILPLVTGFGSMLAALTPLIPLLDDMALLLGVMFAAQKAAAVVSFVAGLWSMVTAAGSATAALSAMGTALVAATGGIAALTTAIGVVVAGLALLIKRNRDAAAATNELQSAQEQLAKREDMLAGMFRVRAQERLVLTKEQILAEQEAGGSSAKLSAARQKEIDTLLGLSDATAAQKMRTGELIEVGEGLRTVEGLLGEGAEGFAVVEAEIEKVTRQLRNYEGDLEKSSGATREFAENRVREWQERLFSLRGALVDARTAQDKKTEAMETARGVLAQISAGSEEAEAKTDSLRKSQEEFADAVASKMRSLRDELRSIGLSDAEAEAERLRQKKADIEAFFAEQIASEQAQGARLAALRKQQADALALVDAIGAREAAAQREAVQEEAEAKLNALRMEGASEAEKIAVERDRVLAGLADADGATRLAIAEEYEQRINAALAGEMQEPDLGPWQRAFGSLRQSLDQAGEAARGLDAAFGEVDEKIGEQVQRLGGIFGKLGQGAGKVARGIGGAFGKLGDKVAEIGNTKIGGAFVEGAKRAAGVAAPLAKAWVSATKGVGVALGEAGKAIAKFAKGAAEAFSGVAGQIGNVITQISGFSAFDPMALVGEALGEAEAARADAAEEARAAAEEAALAGGATEEEAAAAGEEAALAAEEGFDAAGAGASFVDDLIQTAIARAEDFANMAGPVLERLAAGIPELINAVAAALPVIAQSLATQIPVVIQAVIDALPTLIYALVDAVQTVVVALLEALPGLVEALLAQIPGIITKLASAIPVLLEAVVAALPLILNAIIAAIPPILTAIIEAIPVIVLALVEAIPQVLTALLLAIPQIVQAVVGMIPLLITTVIGMIPDIILSLAEQLPDLIAAFIALVPMIITSIVAALPEIALALLSSIFTQLIPMLPLMVAELFAAIIAGMGNALKQIAEGIWEAIKGFFSPFGKKGGKDEKKGKKGAFSGMDYVPATMRMTVHQGEAIIPADRNAEMAGGEIAPAPAGARQNGIGSFGGGSDRPIDIAVMAEGRLLDAVQIVAAKRGHATGVVKEIRRAGGVRVGLSRGRFSAFSSR